MIINIILKDDEFKDLEKSVLRLFKHPTNIDLINITYALLEDKFKSNPPETQHLYNPLHLQARLIKRYNYKDLEVYYFINKYYCDIASEVLYNGKIKCPEK